MFRIFRQPVEKRDRREPAAVSVLSIEEAQYCSDCNAMFKRGPSAAPCCGNRFHLPLAHLLNRSGRLATTHQGG